MYGCYLAGVGVPHTHSVVALKTKVMSAAARHNDAAVTGYGESPHDACVAIQLPNQLRRNDGDKHSSGKLHTWPVSAFHMRTTPSWPADTMTFCQTANAVTADGCNSGVYSPITTRRKSAFAMIDNWKLA